MSPVPQPAAVDYAILPIAQLAADAYNGHRLRRLPENRSLQ
jgi:hypothetical protein